MSTPKPGSAEWQEALNKQVADHDSEAHDTGEEDQNFEIGQGQ